VPYIEAGIELNAPMKWAGGKRWLLPHLEPLWVRAASPRLVEPFCGGLAVALGLRAERALLHRRKYPPDQLLPLAAEGTGGVLALGERQRSVLRLPGPL